MAKIKSWFDCDLQKAVQVQALNGNVFSMDNNGNQICVRIFDGGEKAVISATVTARCILADGSTVNLNGSLTSVNSQSVAVVDIPQSVLLIPGTLKISVQLTASSVVATIAAIITTVYATKTDNVITPSSQVISDWNAEISSQLASAVKFSSQSLTDAQKEQARTNIGAASAAALTEETTNRTAADAELKSALNGIGIEISFVDGLYTGYGSVGDTFNPNMSSNSGWKCAKIAVNAGDGVKILGHASANTRLYIAVDTSNKITQIIDGEYSSDNAVTISIQTDGYLFVNVIGSYTYQCVLYSRDYVRYGLYKDIVFIDGLYSNRPSIGDTYEPTITANSSWKCAKVEVKKHDRIKVYGISSSSTGLYKLVDENDKVNLIQFSSDSSAAKEYEIYAVSDGILYVSSLTTNNTVPYCIIERADDTVSKEYADSVLVYDFDVGYKIGFNYPSNVAVGAEFNPDPTENASWACAKVPVLKGDIVKVKGYASASTRLYIATNTSNIVKQIYGAAHENSNVEQIIVENDGWLYVNAIISYDYSCAIKSNEAFKSYDLQIKDYIKNNPLYYPVNIRYVSGLFSSNVSVGDTFAPDITYNDGWECKKIPVHKNDIAHINGVATVNTRLYIATDKTNIVTQIIATASNNADDVKTITIKSDGWLYVNAVKTSNHACVIESPVYNMDLFEYNTNEYTDNSISTIVETQNHIHLNFDFDTSRIPVQENDSAYPATAEGIYDLYDGLVTAYPDYITKIDTAEAESELGISKPEWMADMDIYLYKFIPQISRRYSSNGKRIKVMVLTGVHADEQMGIFNLFKLMKYICENWKTDVNAAILRTMVEFYIIPCVCPWGYEHVSRINGNGVNLNRNCPSHTWILTQTGQNYSGPSAGSEYETKIWIYYYNQIKPNLFFDQHTPLMNEYGEMGVCLCNKDRKDIASTAGLMCRSISNQLIIEDNAFPDDAQTELYDIHNAYDGGYTGETLQYTEDQGTKYSALFEIAETNKWLNGELTDTVQRNKFNGIQIRECMQNIYQGWMRWIDAASMDNGVS